ncbi:MAG: hypothetical protein BLITH_0251 [Brockia lithotrophica]|uniref:Uncharacterized protein n=1 Tax=Brockia lithotrophica TaxID=933949 RepID=A0A2T5GAG3_9BACL|nr:MAG: hypothetical protein BLITH_0251 [Brockia lithotrophica]
MRGRGEAARREVRAARGVCGERCVRRGRVRPSEIWLCLLRCAILFLIPARSG